MHLHVQGELSAHPSVSAYSWTTANGIAVSVNGPTVEIDWPTAPIPANESFDRMTDEVERALLIESLETVTPIDVHWTAQVVLGAGGSVTISAVGAQSWLARRPPHALDLNAAKAGVAARCPEVRAALEQFRLAMEVWRGDATDSMGRLYLAAEGLVLSLTGDTGRGKWGQLGAAVGFGEEDALRLFFSLQFGRHVNVKTATAELPKVGGRLQPGDCLHEVARLIDEYIAYSTAHVP
jgi:hypothetical protein